MTKETEIRYDDVYREHLEAVNEPAHWAYMSGVLIASFVLMVLLIALLGTGAGG